MQAHADAVANAANALGRVLPGEAKDRLVDVPGCRIRAVGGSKGVLRAVLGAASITTTRLCIECVKRQRDKRGDGADV